MLLRAPDGSYTHPYDHGEPGHGRPRVSVTDAEGAILRELARGRWVLEIGSGIGRSAQFLSEYAIRVHTVDVDPWAREYVESLDLDRVHVYPDVPPAKIYNLAFIDGAHDGVSVAKDIARCLAAMLGGGLIVLHDYKHDEVRGAAKRSGLAWHEMQTEFGMAWAVA